MDSDFNTLKKGLKLAGHIMLAGGAESAVPNTLFSYRECKTEAELSRFINGITKEDLAIGSGHPQGGNPISATKQKGVITPEFNVYDFANLYVCDASVFPSSVGVNPQVTVMAFAQYAKHFIQ